MLCPFLHSFQTVLAQTLPVLATLDMPRRSYFITREGGEDFDREWEFGACKGDEDIQNGMEITSTPYSVPLIDLKPPVDRWVQIQKIKDQLSINIGKANLGAR